MRADYDRGFKSSDELWQQRSVAVYLIDRLALRVGNEKNTDEEADTVGCCSLRVEHVKMDSCSANQLHLNFLGKDSITYDNTTDILPEVYLLIKQFMRKKKPEDVRRLPLVLKRVLPSYRSGWCSWLSPFIVQLRGGVRGHVITPVVMNSH